MDKTSLYAKLLKVQDEVGVIEKDKTNPFHKSKYADINSFLEAVKPILTKHGLVLTQPVDWAATDVHSSEFPVLKTVITDVETGEALVSVTMLPKLEEPQKMGSAITYFRRYALQSLLALQAEDDDGNKASVQEPQNKYMNKNGDNKPPLQTNDLPY